MNAKPKAFRYQTRALLWCGFGGLLLLMAVLGISALSFMHRIQVRQEQIRADYVERDSVIEKIRADIYVSGTYARDFLLDGDDETAAAYKARFFETRARIESNIHHYELLIGANQRAAFDRFRKETLDYLNTVSAPMGWSAAERRERGAAFIDREVLPRRMQAVDFTDSMHLLAEKQLETRSAEVGDLFGAFRTRLVLLLLFTLGAGLTLAGLSLRRILALESEGEIRFQEIVRAQDELKRLSAELLSAQENERRRISRELHDEVGQVLSAIMLGLGNLRVAVANNNGEEALNQLQLVQDMTQRNAGVVRNISLLLRPTMLDDLGLLPALKWLAREVSRTSGIQVDVAVEPSVDEFTGELPEEHRTCVYRVVQEALHNAARHSGAHQIRVYLRQSDNNALRVSIQDDGKGFDPSSEAGVGILGMGERILHLGGTIDVDSQPGKGTIVSFALPVPPQAFHATRPLRTA